MEVMQSSLDMCVASLSLVLAMLVFTLIACLFGAINFVNSLMSAAAAGGSDTNSDSLCSLEQVKTWSAERTRKKSMSIPGGESCFNENPLFYKEGEDEACRRPRRRAGLQALRAPLGVITTLMSCWQQQQQPRDRRRAAALVELSKRQQAALADKQDTIDMLEWQLEQMQVMASREREQLHEMECRSSAASSTSCSSVSTVTTAGEGPAELSATVLLFEMAVVRARLSMRYFCNVFIKQMEVSGYPVCRTLADMEASSGFLRKEHTAFVLDSRINKAFFHCFENDNFDESGVTSILDTGTRCAARLGEYKRMKLVNVADAVNSSSRCFEPDFLRFCQAKTKEMWGLFHMSMLFKSVEEREAFTAAFLDVAKGVWLLHRLAFSMNPPVVILRVGKGCELNPLYVEPVAVPDDPCRRCSSPLKVEFMIMPGFRAHHKIIKCQVYPHIHCSS
ncbi:IRK-interacting protein-like [Selaginella moellendorffii]|uniref:IRK-interacting protein-like n=1 Tax=Selaginella moellendorffii TaxID=88036 RepID=UPI000D1CA964|nr:IRK-interacting protein-like [Selaginella moellendorffii]|eukprot:XP_024530430.1 IRK-interacting protein-like [Selaginella moellendorffii]